MFGALKPEDHLLFQAAYALHETAHKQNNPRRSRGLFLIYFIIPESPAKGFDVFDDFSCFIAGALSFLS